MANTTIQDVDCDNALGLFVFFVLLVGGIGQMMMEGTEEESKDDKAYYCSKD